MFRVGIRSGARTGEKQIVFVSPGDDLRYNRHLVSILGLPEGIAYKCRYPTSWIHSSFLQSKPSLDTNRLKRWFRERIRFNRHARKLVPNALAASPGIFAIITK